jgi:lysophospholipase L1-like esterase
MTFAETMLVLERGAADPWAYPNVLQAQLRDRYPLDGPTVTNRGLGGETLDAGVSRLSLVLAQDRPEVLLLQEGANDVNQGRSPAGIAASLRTMIRTAGASGARVLIGTLLPQRPLGVQGSCRGFGADAVAPANDQIRAMALGEGVTLVDLYQAFGPVPGDLIGPDGLHPSEAGYRAIAAAFFDRLKAAFER